MFGHRRMEGAWKTHPLGLGSVQEILG